MNENLHLIYEVKGGERLPNGGTGFPNIYTVIYGWAQARWYAAMANRDPYWNQNGTWDVGNNRDTKLLQKFASCGGACLETMPDGRQILIMNAGNGVLTYWVLPQRTVNFPNPNYYPSWYAKWAPLIGGIALLAAAAGSQPSPGGNNVVTGGFDSPGIGWVGPGSGCSFTSDTVVLTPEGEQAIGQLQVGEQVVAYNVQSHILEAEPIIHIWVHDDYDLINLTIRPVYQPFVLAARLKSELVHTTSVHPFLTEEEGFVAAGQLQVGMHVLQADGSVGVITMIQRVPGNRMMYNLEVAHDHTFMVGEGQWIVHNDCF